MPATDGAESLPAEPGTYVLVMQIDHQRELSVGRLGTLTLQPGYYLYVGSAQGPGGLKARVERHCRTAKKQHWHIDYLTSAAPVIETWAQTGPSQEHAWAARLGEHLEIACDRFGASDCRCISHLFRSPEKPDLNALRLSRYDTRQVNPCNMLSRSPSM